MGGAVSKISSAVGGLIGNVASPVLGAAGGAVGSGVSAMVNQLGLEVKPADFTNLQAAYAASGGDAAKFNDAFKQLQTQSNSQLGITQQAIGTSQNAINQAAGVTLGTQGQALDYASSMAEGTAPSAAQAQLQSGKDQAIATQMAMANSGNLSQMIGGQRNAMNNAANLNQQSANQAAQLRAEQQIAGMQQYGTQANSASQLAQGISAQQQAQAGQQADIYGNQLNTQQAMSAAENTARANAITAANEKANLEQQANEATAKYKAAAAGGLLNAAGGAATAGITSDENLKKDVKSDKKMLEAFLDKLDAKSFEYKEADGEKGRTEGTHLGVLAQDVEKAPGGKSMVIEMPEGKGIDMPSAVGMLMAAASNMHDRVKDIEELFKAKAKAKKG